MGEHVTSIMSSLVTFVQFCNSFCRGHVCYVSLSPLLVIIVLHRLLEKEMEEPYGGIQKLGTCKSDALLYADGTTFQRND